MWVQNYPIINSNVTPFILSKFIYCCDKNKVSSLH